MNARVGMLLVALPAIVAAQAAVENAIIVGPAATAAAPAKGVGQGIAGAFEKLTHTLESGDAKSAETKPVETKTSARSLKPARAQKTPPAEPKAEVSYEDPSGIEKGMEYAEVVRRFGPPALKLTTGPGEETLSYAKKDVSVGVTMRNGKVASVQKAGG